MVPVVVNPNTPGFFVNYQLIHQQIKFFFRCCSYLWVFGLLFCAQNKLIHIPNVVCNLFIGTCLLKGLRLLYISMSKLCEPALQHCRRPITNSPYVCESTTETYSDKPLPFCSYVPALTLLLPPPIVKSSPLLHSLLGIIAQNLLHESSILACLPFTTTRTFTPELAEAEESTSRTAADKFS